MGRGGSPTEYDQGLVDQHTGNRSTINSTKDFGESSKVTGFMVPVRRNNVTTVRVRTKNNSFVYGESSMEGPPGHIQGMQQTKLQQRMNEKLAKLREYQELKAQKQIELIEEKQQALRERQQQEMEAELRRRKRAESLKIKLSIY